MSHGSEVFRVIEVLRALPVWDVAEVGQVLGVRLFREPFRAVNYKFYGCAWEHESFERVEFKRAIQAGTGGGVSITLRKTARVSESGLKRRFPTAPSTVGVLPAPAPGAPPGMPPTMLHFLEVPYPPCSANFIIEGADPRPFLVSFSVSHVRAPQEPSVAFPSDSYRAYSLSEGADERFVIERVGAGTPAISVEQPKLAQRTLNVTYTVLDEEMGDDTAEALIRCVLLGTLLRSRYDGRIDLVCYSNSETQLAQLAH
ncbi:MAG: hypothetical protein QM756_45675 [Polyangiaceae bacterium]